MLTSPEGLVREPSTVWHSVSTQHAYQKKKLKPHIAHPSALHILDKEAGDDAQLIFAVKYYTALKNGED